MSNADLSQEIARQIAALFNQSGAMQLSFDGLEGNWSTGYGQYGCALFVRAWYDALKPELRGQVINDASLPGHSNWHINTRMNWGEPWYGGFRESQTLYRFKNQVYFERNLMPRMLGWFALRPETSVEDAEWLLARAAGFHAGFTLATSLASTAQLEADPRSADTARKFGEVPAILNQAIRQWETARTTRAFPDAIRAALRDNTREFHLEPTGPRSCNSSGEAFLQRFSHDLTRIEPSTFAFDPRESTQPPTWTLHSTSKAPLTGVQLTWNETAVAGLAAVTIPAGGRLRYAGGADLVVTDAGWKEVSRVPVEFHRASTARRHTLVVRTQVPERAPSNSRSVNSAPRPPFARIHEGEATFRQLAEDVGVAKATNAFCVSAFSMSKAFTRESDDAPESSVSIRPASVLPPGTKNYMTAGGIQRLREEFQRITDVLARTPVASGTRSVLEVRCQQLQHTLETAVVVPATARDQRVRFGATVSVRSRGGEESEYRIVGVDETDVDRDWVSWLSPIAKALTGRAVGERVRIRLPAGETELEIMGIRYEE